MKRTLLTLCLLGAGCSVLFDPAQVAPKACPASPAACAPRTNATATCDDNACRYSCDEGFVDSNGDLNGETSDGCELSCRVGVPPVNPAGLTATVGARGGAVQWTFPIAAATAAVRYKLCTATPGAPEACLLLEPATACPLGLCATTTEGHVDSLRITGRVLSVDTCGREGPAATAATVSATPIDTSDPAGWVLEKSCPATLSSVVGGQLAIENPSFNCASSLASGDELWGDLTLDADLRYSTGSDNAAAGLALQVNSTGHRLGALVFPSTVNASELATFTQRLNGTEKVVAGSSRGANLVGTTHLRVVSRGGVQSFSVGPDAQQLQELIRWPDPTARTGRIGIGLAGTGRVEFTNFRVTTASTLPAAGATSTVVTFADGGFPPDARPRGPVRIVPCPALPSSARCDGGCLPEAGALCARTQTLANLQSVVVDLPVGIDVRAPYSLSLRFAVAPDGGGSFPFPLNTPQGGLLAANSWPQTTRGLGQEYGVVLEAGAWHAAAFTFNADGGRFAVSLDEQPVALPLAPFPQPGNSAHLGPISVGLGLASDIYVSELRISQP